MYIYKIFGVHYCANVVTEKEDYGCAVLLRALIPIAGTELMMKRRGLTDIKSLCRGPGNLTKSFSLDYRHNKASLSSNSLFILNTELSDKHQIITSQRIGISKDTELPYRFFIKNCPYVSGKKSYYL